MKFKSYIQNLQESVFRDSLYHITGLGRANSILNRQAFQISGAESLDFDDYWDDDDDDEFGDAESSMHLPYISFARSRGGTFVPTSSSFGSSDVIFVSFEFDKGEIEKNTRREGASFEPYSFFNIPAELYGRKTRRFGNSPFRKDIQRDGTEDEMEERLWFEDSNEQYSRGVYDSIEAVHIIMNKDNRGYNEMEEEQLEMSIDDFEKEGWPIFYYDDMRDYIRGRATMDPFEAERSEPRFRGRWF